MKNVYIHIPFCANNCAYCNFTKTNLFTTEIQTKYFASLKTEIVNSKYLLKNDVIKTLYFGGGTPSLVFTDILKDFLHFIKTRFNFSAKIEITLECNPITINETKLLAWQAMGINRLSLGIQTFQTKFSNFLNRDLTKNLNSILAVKKHNLNLSCDFIFGFPKQSLSDLNQDLVMIKSLNLDHISYYALDYKINSAIENSKNKALDFKVICDYYEFISENLISQKYDHYEIYNFARKKLICKHNYDFWQQKDYLGFGLGAVSFINNQVTENTVNLDQYLWGNFIQDQYKLEIEEQIELHLKRALHLKFGFKIRDLANKFPQINLNKLIIAAKNLPIWFFVDGDKISLTNLGKMNLLECINYLM